MTLCQDPLNIALFNDAVALIVYGLHGWFTALTDASYSMDI
jgi:hypothetical protein